MNSSRWGTGVALCVQAANGTNELKYAVCGGCWFHLMFLFYVFSHADGIDAKLNFVCKTFNFVEGWPAITGGVRDTIAYGAHWGEASSFTSQHCSRGEALRWDLCSSVFHSEVFIDNEGGNDVITFFKKSQDKGDNCNLCSSAKAHIWIVLGITGPPRWL